MAQISVVIACVNGLPEIAECLAALKKQQGGVEAEIIVANCCKDGTSETIKKEFPDVALLNFSERLSIPELRAIGMSKASGEIIAIIEDHCNVQKNWFKEILKAHEKGYKAVGGAVVNGSVERIIDWAVFFCEYSPIMPPVPEGEVEWIAGNNASYRRDVIEKIDDKVKRNYWEYFLHEELRKAGAKFLFAPAIVVSHKKRFGLFYFLAQRFYYSRSFAGMRKERVSAAKRIFYILTSPLLPILMLWRISKQIVVKKQHVKEFLMTLPLLFIFMISYAIGEFVGYIFGVGNSLLKVE